MAVISIVGTTGVGKSFLVKQLASLECMPAFFEGEEGVIPHEILQSVFSKKDPTKRFQWFGDHYKRTFARARQVSNAGLDAYVDGAPVTVEAIMADEDDKSHIELLKHLEELTHFQSDIVVLLTATESALKELIKDRGRGSELHLAAVRLAVKIQDEFLRLTKNDKNVVIIDRTKLDFVDENDLKKILAMIKNKKSV